MWRLKAWGRDILRGWPFPAVWHRSFGCKFGIVDGGTSDQPITICRCGAEWDIRNVQTNKDMVAWW